MSRTATQEDTRTLLSPAEIARIAGVSRKTIYRAVDQGDLRASHVGRLLRIAPDDFRAYLEREGA